MHLSLITWLAAFALGAGQSTKGQESVVLDITGGRLEVECGQVYSGSSDCRMALHLFARSGDHTLELVSDGSAHKKPSFNLLALGKYNAVLIKDDHDGSYLSSRVYELQYPDGRKERFIVIGDFVKDTRSASPGDSHPSGT